MNLTAVIERMICVQVFLYVYTYIHMKREGGPLSPATATATATAQRRVNPNLYICQNQCIYIVLSCVWLLYPFAQAPHRLGAAFYANAIYKFK